MATEPRIIVLPTDVTEVTDRMEALFRSAPQWGDNAKTTIDNEIEGVSNMVKNNAAHMIMWPYAFKVIGCCAIGILQQTPNAWNRNHFALMLLSKHEAYGAAPLTKWGPLGILIRISSKFERYKNLLNAGDTLVVEESIQDTLRDIVGYCVLGVVSSTRKEQAS